MKGDTNMSEKRGYPNPNYTEEDVMADGEILEEIGLVTLEPDHYEELVSKAAMLDCLASAIKSMGKVDDDVVKAITGTLSDQPIVPKKEADNYWSYYTRESAKNRELESKVSQLERARNELIEILKQHGLCETGEIMEAEVKHDGENSDHRESDA
jgi:hypothetical protein